MTEIFKQETTTPQYSEFIHKSRYARWLDDKNRRETWDETVSRYTDYWRSKYDEGILPKNTLDLIYKNIHDLKVMPSMRALMTAGKALDRDNVAGYNCAYIAIEDQKVFDEILYVLTCGTGMGFSVERQYINNLPIIPEEMFNTETIIKVRDSKIGWASAYRELISLLYSGKIPEWDTSKVREAGARLKTFGGRASGPGPLEDLFEFTVSVFKNASGRKLTSVECHDLVCKIAEIVVVGGVRRSALISLSNLSDDRMRVAKSGSWWDENPQRALANNSVNYTEKPEMSVFIKEWLALYESKSGERGLFSSLAASKLIPERRKELGWVGGWGTNPCSEIILRDSGQMCNLSEVIIRPDDTLEKILDKIEVATIIGSLQSTRTNFRYLRKQWQKNCEEERLLGVSLTGIMDHPVLNGAEPYHYKGALLSNPIEDWLTAMKEKAVETNKIWSERLGINQATAITAVKPSGTVSQLTDTASGIHPRYAPFYIRTVRADVKDPLAQLMIDKGVPNEPDVMKPDSTVIFSFPVKAPKHSVFRDDRTALEQLELWKIYQLFYCEHKPSITVYVKEDEWIKVAAWVYENFEIISGISFLPHSNHSYKQAPYQEITEEVYEELLKEVVEIDWDELSEYELTDQTTSAKELACAGGMCEL